MRQAIITKCIPATDHWPARIEASCEDGKVRIDCDASLTTKQNHYAAAKALCEGLGWIGSFLSAYLPDNAGYCFVCMEDDETGTAREPSFTQFSGR